ncbi:membrane lipoprotein lipid attachment site-containing protein [Vagococcus sp. DIV0080]|uniref:Membrane lipoprotein lipid attachment site-containing protein n=1 Tax=Candidatus Vagococcus giribetii TaxID=2230876 RepID=A0ABS3HW51_9ENTE|nr:membrane lipoprotein lipid attachment site-containing protein [Vagococcus sp. DIV0080]MBO0477984.1 membrane lipoprotein lipid attachment site-containing protein [Vagococcus sp. DIV0080]
MKKIFSTIVLLLVLAGGGYFIYTEFVKAKTPDVVAVDTGTITVDQIDQKEFEKLDKETKELIKKYEYVETVGSFDELNGMKQEDGSYIVPKYGDKKLYLISAAKQKEGQVVAIFSDKEKN